MDILQGLNDVQKQALLETEGAVLVTAGAGSGKTRLLTHRIAYLIKEIGISESNILAITFTNKAAREMKERVSSLVGEGNNVWISTFHSMCVKILRRDIHHLEGFDGNFTIYSDTDMEKALKPIIKDLGLSDSEYKQYAYHISACKNQNMDLIKYISSTYIENAEMFEKIYTLYENKLRSCNALDFDDLLVKTYELLVSVPSVREYYTNKFRYILVDEIQDTNVVQYDLIKVLSSKYKNVFAVGDEDQCIYTWRGADFKNIFNFKEDYQNTKMFKLEQNYRCTKNILEKANNLIANNTERFAKELWTNNDEGKNVEYYEQYDEQTEAESVVSKIYALTRAGYKYSDIAILMRLNALTLPFEQKLLAYNIPHRIYGGFRFYERVEIKNVIAYLRLFVNPKDEVSLLRIINFPKRAIGDAAINKMREMAEAKNLSILEMLIELNKHPEENKALHSKVQSFVETYLYLKQIMPTTKLDDFVELVINQFAIKSVYENNKEEDQDKLLNLDSLINSVSVFAISNPDAGLGDYLESITLESDIDHMDETDQVTIATVHAVKGLEFKVVFVIGLEEGIFPISRAFNSKRELEEERRLMYVAMTRAEERLFISSADTRFMYGKRSYTQISRFIEEAGLRVSRKPVERDIYSHMASSKPVYTKSSESYNNKTTFNITKPSISNVSITKLLSDENEQDEKLKDTKEYAVGQVVSHPKFGTGTIKAIVDDGVCGEIEFEGFGKKTLILSIAPLKIIN